MKYDGVVLRIDDNLFLFVLNPDTKNLTDGVNISAHECYDNLKKNQLVVVNTIFKDGTEEIEKIDLDEFIHGDKYGKYDTFILISDVITYTIPTLSNMLKKGELNMVGKTCIDDSKNDNKIDE